MEVAIAEIHRKNQTQSRLNDWTIVLRRLGLENVIMFMCGLLPSCVRELVSLFVIRQQEVQYGYATPRPVYIQPLYSYELGLLQECANGDIKQEIAHALFNAAVINLSRQNALVKDRPNRVQQSGLLRIFTDHQCKTFLEKIYGRELKVGTDGCLTMSVTNRNGEGCPSVPRQRPTAGVIRRTVRTIARRLRGKSPPRDKVFFCDSYVVGCLQMYDCTALDIVSEMTLLVVHSDIPVDVLPMLTSGVCRQVDITHCTLLCGRNNVERCDVVNKMQTASPRVRVELMDVRGLRQLKDYDITLPNVGQLCANGLW